MFTLNFKKSARGNSRQVLETEDHTRVIVTSIPPGHCLGEEMQDNTDKIFVIVEGEGIAMLDGEVVDIGSKEVILAPAGTLHDIINTTVGKTMKMLTIFTPLSYPPATSQAAKATPVTKWSDSFTS